MVGSTSVQSINHGCIATFTASGQLDPSFNGTGTLIAVNNTVSQFNAVAVQGSAASGYNIVLAGHSFPTRSLSAIFSSVTRYSLTGALDTSFGGTGTGAFTIGGGHWFMSLAVESEG
jgi:hypothetical protein